jgi:hypothetical protein
MAGQGDCLGLAQITKESNPDALAHRFAQDAYIAIAAGD